MSSLLRSTNLRPRSIRAVQSVQSGLFSSTSGTPKTGATPLSQFGGVHGGKGGVSRMWRNKPLLRREGDRIFKTGLEASQLLIGEAGRKDKGEIEFMSSWESMANSLSVVFDRHPKYAWVLKLMTEAERTVAFRVAWIDDTGISRVNRGFRVQYSSALGPYEGPTTFSSRVNYSNVKANAFDTTFTNALSGKNMGGAYGGADFNPYDKSENEIQRFCQSYMTELSKYIGPDEDLPGMGDGCGPTEIGYMYGQYKRINAHCGQLGKGLLWGGSPMYVQQAQGLGIAYFAKKMLQDKGMSLEGKRCIITGSNATSLALAEKLAELGAVPLTFSDTSGYIYEPSGFDAAKVKTVQKIKAERGARVGRYIMASTAAKFNEPASIYDIPCDLVFSCSRDPALSIDEHHVAKLASGGCSGVVEGVALGMTNAAMVAAKKRGMLHAPYRATTVGGSIFNGLTIASEPLQLHAGETIDSRVESCMSEVYEEIRSTAKEFNTRGDLNAGANIAAFLRVADVMLAHGSV